LLRKTTLLNALAKRINYANVDGDVTFSGRTMTAQDLTYVPQFDAINGALTVEEHFLLVGRLTCVDVEDMLARAEKLLEVLGLTEKRHFKVIH
jgi:ABC-type multidrug transport system ATPase subunit